MTARPAALAGVRLNEIGQGDPELDVHFAKRGELVARPGQTMEVHVPRLDLRTVLAERQQRVLDHEGGVIRSAAQGAVEIGNAPAVAAKHRQLLGLRASGVEPPAHGG